MADVNTPAKNAQDELTGHRAIPRLDDENVTLAEARSATNAIHEFVRLYDLRGKRDGFRGNREGLAVLDLPGKFNFDRVHMKAAGPVGLQGTAGV